MQTVGRDELTSDGGVRESGRGGVDRVVERVDRDIALLLVGLAALWSSMVLRRSPPPVGSAAPAAP